MFAHVELCVRGFKKPLLQKPRDMIRGSELQPGRHSESEPKHSGKEPEEGLGASTENRL